MSLQRCQRETTSTEFLDWLEYLKRDVNVRRREDYFLANIAKEIRMTIAKNPRNVKLEPFLLEFKTKESTRQPNRRKNTLSQWLRWAGIKVEK